MYRNLFLLKAKKYGQEYNPQVLDNGKNASDLMRLCGIPDYPARKTMEAARRFTPNFCRKAAQLVLETDYKIKTSFDDPQRMLEMLILELAQEARNG